MKKFHNRSAALAATPTAVIALSFVPGLQPWAPALWSLGLAGMMGALVYVTSHRHASPTGSVGQRPRRRLYLLAAIVATGALLGSLLVSTSGARAQSPVGLPVAEASGDVSLGTLRERLVAATGDLGRLDGAEASTLVRAAADRRVEPASGLRADYENARVFVEGATKIVSVPLLGTDLPEVTNLTFISAGGVTQVTEMAAEMISSDVVHLAIWQDGVQTKNVELSSTAPGAQGGVAAKGFSMDKLKKCLDSAGLNWALIAVVGAACGIACATAVLCAPCLALNAGLTGGTVAKCVKIAFS